MKTEKIINNKITTKQKIKFFEFCLDLFTSKIPETVTDRLIDDGYHKSLGDYGFCLLYKNFFGENTYGFNLLPELRRHTPRKHFYTYENKKTDEHLFWFPLGGDQKKRIAICNKILTKLKSS